MPGSCQAFFWFQNFSRISVELACQVSRSVQNFGIAETDWIKRQFWPECLPVRGPWYSPHDSGLIKTWTISAKIRSPNPGRVIPTPIADWVTIHKAEIQNPVSPICNFIHRAAVACCFWGSFQAQRASERRNRFWKAGKCFWAWTNLCTPIKENKVCTYWLPLDVRQPPGSLLFERLRSARRTLLAEESSLKTLY